MSFDIVVCSEPHCSSTDTFLCVKHCQRYVCFEHLQVHHRIYELEKKDLPTEYRRKLQHCLSAYNGLINEAKLKEQEKRDIEIACTEIRRTYEQRRQDYHRLQNEIVSTLQLPSTVNDLKTNLEKLEVAIEREQQRVRIYANSDTLASIKMEPNEFMTNMNLNEDRYDNINHTEPSSTLNSIDRLMNNNNRRHENHFSEEESQSDATFSDGIDHDSDSEDHHHHRTSTNHSSSSSSHISQSVAIYRGACPLTNGNAFGILPIHNIRLCEGKSSCLYNHLQSFHHMTATSAYKICRALLHQQSPDTTILFQANDVLYNRSFHMACPFTGGSKNPFDCQPKFIIKAPCSSVISRLDMPRHLRDVHHIRRTAALKIVAEMRRCAQMSEGDILLRLNRNIFESNDNIIELNDTKSNAQTTKRSKREK